MKKPLAKRRTLRTKVKPRAPVEPSRLAIAALERIASVLTKSGKIDRLGPPATDREIDAQQSLLGKGRALPPSYVAALREHSRIGDPEILLTAMEIAGRSSELVGRLGSEAACYFRPSCVALPLNNRGDVIEYNNAAARIRRTLRHLRAATHQHATAAWSKYHDLLLPASV